MKPRISIITIGVDDLERAVRFYRDGLGFPTRGIVGTEYEHGAVAFFDLVNGQKHWRCGPGRTWLMRPRFLLVHEVPPSFHWDTWLEAKPKSMRSSIKPGGREPS